MKLRRNVSRVEELLLEADMIVGHAIVCEVLLVLLGVLKNYKSYMR
jgi:hypothetical protein